MIFVSHELCATLCCAVQERVVTRTRDATGQLMTEEHHAGNSNTCKQRHLGLLCTLGCKLLCIRLLSSLPCMPVIIVHHFGILQQQNVHLPSKCTTIPWLMYVLPLYGSAGIDPSSAHQFDQQWTQRAQQTMPHWMQQPNTAQRIGPGGRQQQQQLALPPGQAPAQQYGQQQQQYYQQQGGAGGYVQQQGMGYGQQEQMRGDDASGNGSGWSGGYHV